MKAIAPALLILLLAACSAQKPAPVVPPPRPVASQTPAPVQPAPRALADWRDAPQTPGTWQWSVSEGRSTATYGLLGAAPLARLVCYRERGQVGLQRAGTAAVAVPMAVRTTSTSRALSGDPQRGGAAWLEATFTARDPLLDAMAFSRGRFALEAAGQPTLYLPSWPEVSRVIEDCR